MLTTVADAMFLPHYDYCTPLTKVRVIYLRHFHAHAHSFRSNPPQVFFFPCHFSLLHLDLLPIFFPQIPPQTQFYPPQNSNCPSPRNHNAINARSPRLHHPPRRNRMVPQRPPHRNIRYPAHALWREARARDGEGAGG